MNFGNYRWVCLIVLAASMLAGGAAARAAELIMFETEGCEWCEKWRAEIGPVYPLTPEGKFAPLRRVEIARDLPADLAGFEGIYFTPTFVVLDGGKEVGRIIGYPGEAFFWGLLGEILKKHGLRPPKSPPPADPASDNQRS